MPDFVWLGRANANFGHGRIDSISRTLPSGRVEMAVGTPAIDIVRFISQESLTKDILPRGEDCETGRPTIDFGWKTDKLAEF